MVLTGVNVTDPESGAEYPRIDMFEAVTRLVSDEDCDTSGTPDFREIINAERTDCDGNWVPDVCQIAADPQVDCNTNGVLDPCEGLSLNCGVRFSRGDVNVDGTADITDYIEALGFMFLGVP